MATQVLPIGSGGSFLESPVFNHSGGRRANPPPTGFGLREIGIDHGHHENPTLPVALNFSSASMLEKEVVEHDLNDQMGLQYDCLSPAAASTPGSYSQANTPDSGFYGVASVSMHSALKTSESDYSANTPTSCVSGNGSSGNRKRKTVNFDESQTSIVMISPDDLYNQYNRGQSLESRDNPFLPGGELSREAEDLLSRATIIRDNFYLNEEEKRALREQQQLQQQQQQQQQQQEQQLLLQQQQQQKQKGTKHVQIVDHQDGQDVSPAVDCTPNASSPAAVEERISPQAAGNSLSSAPLSSSPNGGGDHRHRVNGNVGEGTSPDSVKIAIPDVDGQPAPPGSSDNGGQGAPGSGGLTVHESDKKRRNKCCSVM